MQNFQHIVSEHNEQIGEILKNLCECTFKGDKATEEVGKQASVFKSFFPKKFLSVNTFQKLDFSYYYFLKNICDFLVSTGTLNNKL